MRRCSTTRPGSSSWRVTYRYDFAAACVVDDGGRIVAGLPWGRIESRLTGRRLVALPFSDACEPLTDGASVEELARAIDEHRRATGLGLEVRWLMDSLSEGVAVHRYWRHTLPLESDADAVHKRARSGIRRGASKARREGLTFERRTDQQRARRLLPASPEDAQAPGSADAAEAVHRRVPAAVRARARVRRARLRRRPDPSPPPCSSSCATT